MIARINPEPRKRARCSRGEIEKIATLLPAVLIAMSFAAAGTAQPPDSPQGLQDHFLHSWQHGANWQTWWRLNQDRFADLRQQIHFPRPLHSSPGFHEPLEEGVAPASLAPSAKTVADWIIPALRDSVRNALRDSDQADLHKAALIALV
ncbi:MAG: hypothetical protein AAF196_20695 [Planctomycetota bacterium]